MASAIEYNLKYSFKNYIMANQSDESIASKLLCFHLHCDSISHSEFKEYCQCCINRIYDDCFVENGNVKHVDHKIFNYLLIQIEIFCN